MKSTCLLRGMFAAALACASAAHAEMTWSSYDSSGARVSANAAVFDPATGTYNLTIPANSSRTFVTTNFVPITVTPPASSRTLTPVAFSMQATGGYGTGGSVQNKFTGFGLFSTHGTLPAASGNFTDDTGLWITLYQQSNASFNTKPSGVKSAAPSCPANLVGTNATTYGLGTARGGTGGVIVDNQQVDVVFTLVLNSSGTWQIGNTTSATATATSAPGGLFTDHATGGTTLQRTVYSDASSALTGAQTFDEFGFLFENGTGSDVTLSLSGFTLVGPPYIVVQPPSSPSVTLGGSLTLTTTAGGNPAGYQWQFSSDGGANYTNIGGATAASHTITNAQASDAGLYRLVVTNAAGSATSAVAQVSVTSGAVAPSIQTQPTGATILVGGSKTFSVLANGTAPLSYQWQISTDAGANYTDIPGATDASYVIGSATLGDDATYRVIVTNAAGSAPSDPAVLVVQELPAISVPPVGAVLSPGSGYTLSVTASGTPAPTYQWKLDDVAISGATAGTLPLTLSAAVSGAYSVTVTNAAGSVTSVPVYVGVPSSDTASFFPADDASGINPDTPLSLTFPGTPRVGTTGKVRVFDGATDALVETIDLGALTVKKSSDVRLVPQQVYRVGVRSIGGVNYNYQPIVVTGNTARIYLKSSTTLVPGHAYYVQIEPGVLLDATGATYPGIADATTWSFSTRASAPAAGASSYTVAADGTGDFTTVQGAIDSIPYSPANTTPVTLDIRNGVYTEIVHVRAGQNNLTLRGQSRDGVLVACLNNGDMYNGVHQNYRGVMLVEANDFRLENLSVRNLTLRYGSQAEAFTVQSATQRTTVSRASFYSLQDTILANPQVFFTDSYIEGDVDFMWGVGGCFYQRCTVKSMNPGYLTQIRNTQTTMGNVYLGCRFVAAPGLADASVVLARIDPAGYPYSQCVYIDCALGTHIKPAGWQLDGATVAPNVRFWEYGSTDLAGLPLDISGRATYNHNATGVGGSTVLDHQQIDAASADFLRIPANVCGFTPSVAPVIDVSPASAALATGASATLSVDATVGYPAATYQWYRGASPIDGATSATYVISSASAADVGDYTVVLTNTAGTATSAIASVSVSSPPSAYDSYVQAAGLNPATDGAPTANPSGDGIANLLKFVLGGDPLVPQPDLLPVATVDASGGTPLLVYVYDRNTAAAAAVAGLDVQYSTDFATWTTVAAGVDGVSITTTPVDANNEHVEVRIPMTAPKGFARLRVTAP